MKHRKERRHSFWTPITSKEKKRRSSKAQAKEDEALVVSSCSAFSQVTMLLTQGEAWVAIIKDRGHNAKGTCSVCFAFSFLLSKMTCGQTSLSLAACTKHHTQKKRNNLSVSPFFKLCTGNIFTFLVFFMYHKNKQCKWFQRLYWKQTNKKDNCFLSKSHIFIGQKYRQTLF